MRKSPARIGPLLLALSCAPEPITGPTVTLTRVRDNAEFPCEDSLQCGLTGGQDAIRVRASYPELDFDRDDLPDVPALVLRLDGDALEEATPMFSVDGGSNVPTFESGNIRLPGRPRSTLSLRVEGAPGYFTERSGFTVSPGVIGDPMVTGCGSDRCARFAVGLSATAHIEIQSWLDSETKVTLRTLLDNVPDSTQEASFEGSLSQERHAVFNVPVPNVAVKVDSPREWRLEFATEGVSIPPVKLLLDRPPAPLIVVSGCGESTCTEFEAGVGRATVEIKSEIAAGSKVRLRSVVRGGELETQEQTFAGEAGDLRVARFEVDVPSVFVDGDSVEWRLELESEQIAFPVQKLSLVPPDFSTIFVGCKTPCTVEPGGELTLQASAPASFTGRSITVRTLVNDLPGRDSLELALEALEGNTRSGIVTIKAPASPNTRLEAKVYFGSGYVSRAAATTTPLSED